MSPELHQTVATLEDNMARVVLGKRDVVRLCIVALLAGEHILLEDVPGVGKTLIGKALAKSVDAKFCRIQFTPDLLPSDIVGSSVFNGKTNEFFYSQGPIFANIVLADEINRTTPRTQSALLEAMSDNQVSADGHTYPLPESQLDRFLLRTSVGYPDREDELRVLTSHRRGEPVEELRSVISTQQVVDMQEAVRSVTVDDSIHEYLLDLVDATRRSDDLHVGVSTRGTLALYRAAQSLAFIEGRDFVIPDDIKRLAVPVLGHRVIAKGFLTGNSRDHVENIVQRLLGEVAVPQ